MTHIEFHGKVKTLRHEPVCFIEGIAKKASVQNGLRKERNMGGEVRWCRVPQRRWKWWRSTELEWFNTIYIWKEGFPGGARDKEPTCQCRRHKETLVWSLVLEDPLEEGNVTHSSILVWRIPWWPWKLPILRVNVDCCYSVAKSCLTLYNSMDCSTPGFPVHHHLLEVAQNHVHWVSDDIQPSHPLSPPSPPAFNLSQHQGLFQ